MTAPVQEIRFCSPHTIHRDVANIRVKLRQPTRAAAAAATRIGLI